MPVDPQVEIRDEIARFRSEVEANLDGWADIGSALELREMELMLAALTRSLADGITGTVLGAKLADPAFQASASMAARRGVKKYRNGGRRDVSLRLLGGTEIRVGVEYLKPDRNKMLGRKRKNRGKGGAGVYPALAALGIWWGVTPALAGEISRQVADSESVRVARQTLARRDIDLGHKQTLRIVNKVGDRAVQQRNAWMESIRNHPCSTEGPLVGKRVVVATDGGRVRLRVPNGSGRLRKTGHRGFKTPWKEPKVIAIYVVGKNGRFEKTFHPVYDGTMGDSDAVFAMLVAYLKALGAASADQLIVVGDGAKWIWERVPYLAHNLGIPQQKVVEVIDWYHAVERLHEIAAVPSRWSPTKRRRWVRAAKELLSNGQVPELVEHIRTLARGRRAKAVVCHIPYFERNERRMRYARFKLMRIPIGSGAVESAVRRIVNMRLKGSAKFWLKENAESMLMLRSYLKAGRFDHLIDWSLSQAVPWWVDATGTDLLEVQPGAYEQKALKMAA